MKSKKRHQESSDEVSDDLSDKSSSSSDSESEASSESDARHKKRRKRDESPDSESDEKRSKKRKNKKKKKKHGKKKRRSESVESVLDDNTSISEGEISPKKKRKHKHKHSKRNPKDSVSEDDHEDRRLQSVVKERRGSSEEVEEPTHTYYQKEYRRPITDEYEREKEVQRFYRGSSREHRRYPEAIHYERNERHADKYERPKEKRDPRGHYPPEEYERQRRQREYEEYKRQHRYEERRSPEVENYRKPREDAYVREHDRGYVRVDRHDDRRRREVEDERDYRERRQPPEPDRYRVKEYPDRREKFHDDRERYPEDRGRDSRRERPPPPRIENPPPPRRREISRSRSPEDRYREKRRPERIEREERYVREDRRDVRRDDRRDDRRDRPVKEEADGNHSSKDDPRSKERKSRFTDGDDKKEYSWGKTDVKTEAGKPGEDKEKPNFGLSGKLTADANTVNGVVIKYTEPDDAKQPKRRWRFYPFKGDKALPILYIHRQSAFLIGRDKKVVDIALEHPSISKQHAALQYRATPFTRPDGSQGRRVRPYVIDLESANGTFVNNKKIDPRRYVELLERDVVKFGFSQREYVLLHENSKDDAQDDDHHDPVEIGAAVTTTEQIKKEKRAKDEIKEDGE